MKMVDPGPERGENLNRGGGFRVDFGSERGKNFSGFRAGENFMQIQ